MTAEIVDGVMIIKAENEDETIALEKWRVRRTEQPKGKWLEAHYYNPIQVLVI